MLNDNDEILCIHGVGLRIPCTDCQNWRSDDPRVEKAITGTLAHLGCADVSIPADQCEECKITREAEAEYEAEELLEADDPTTVRLRAIQAKKERLGLLLPGNVRAYLSTRNWAVSRETVQTFQCTHTGNWSGQCLLCGTDLDTKGSL